MLFRSAAAALAGVNVVAVKEGTTREALSRLKSLPSRLSVDDCNGCSQIGLTAQWTVSGIDSLPIFLSTLRRMVAWGRTATTRRRGGQCWCRRRLRLKKWMT
jgi:hypothetical protein